MNKHNEYDDIPLSRILPMWRQQVKKLSLEANALHAENARLKSEVERLKLDYYENKTGEVSATVVQTFNTETGEADYVVSLEDYKKMAGMFSAEFSRFTDEVKRLTLLQAETLSERNKAEAEIERLTAKQIDIDRVQAQSDFYRSKLMNETEYTANVQMIDQVKHLEARVERLTKAGDAMAKAIEIVLDSPYDLPSYELDKSADSWNAAKDGIDP